jgi:L-ascorbate metabolism protein UlaG (beta-lactamase superfamily)
MSRSRTTLAIAVLMLSWSTSPTAAEPIEVLYLGHSTFRITSPTGKVIVIDPFLKANPKTPPRYKDLKELGKVDLILITHGHADHMRDLAELATMTGASVIANFELGNSFIALGITDGSKTIVMNKGGTVAPLGPGIKVHMVPAEHSSSVPATFVAADAKDKHSVSGGNAVGYVLELENGFRIYHSGDTDVFSDMALINRFHKPDLALICIGGHFTMDPERAAYAIREFIRPKQVIPMHYGTFPVINRTPAEFKTALGNTAVKLLDVKPGDAVKF